MGFRKEYMGYYTECFDSSAWHNSVNNYYYYFYYLLVGLGKAFL